MLLEDLRTFFTLTTNLRSPTSNSLKRHVIINDALPALMARTRSLRLKSAISKVLLENRRDHSITSRGA